MSILRRVILVLSISSCGEAALELPDAGSFDAGSFDAGSLDAGSFDAGSLDAGSLDAGSFDAGAYDAGAFDAGSFDAGATARVVTICLNGACSDLSASCASNSGFTAICDALQTVGAGVVLDGTSTTWATFPSTSGSSLVSPLFSALDRTGDGLVTAADGPISLNVLGFSWGGANAADLANRITSDSRVSQSVVRTRLIVLDGFQPGISRVAAAPGVDESWSFRHSIAPPGDCSNGAPLGPYLGRRLACAAGQACRDFDFSLAPAGASFNGIAGTEVGHCDVPLAATALVFDLLLSGAPQHPLPPTVAVTP